MSKKNYRLLTLTVAIFCLVGAFAQVGTLPGPARRTPTLLQLNDTQKIGAIGKADAVLMATVLEVKLPVIPKNPPVILVPRLYRNATNLSIAAEEIAQITMKIDKVDTGNFKAGETIILPLQLQPLYMRVDGKRVQTGWTPDLSVNEQRLFLLQRVKNCFILPMGINSMRPVDELPQWETALANMPVKVSPPSAQTAINIGSATLTKFTIRNNSDQPVNVTSVSFSGYYLAKKMNENLQLEITDATGYSMPADRTTQLQLENKDAKESNIAGDDIPRLEVTEKPGNGIVDKMPNSVNPLEIAPKTEKTLTFYLTASPPQAWVLFDEESYMMTPIAIRTILHVFMKNAEGNIVNTDIFSPLTTMYAGYPLTITDLDFR